MPVLEPETLASLLRRRAAHEPLDLPLAGRSMGRWWEAADRLQVVPGDRPRPGEVWVFVSPQGQMVAHRCLSAAGDAPAVFRGDGNVHRDPLVARTLLVGRVTAVQRGERWHALGAWDRARGKLARAETQVRRVTASIRRRVVDPDVRRRQRARIRTVGALLRDPDRKSVARMVVEFASLTIRQRELPRHYVRSLMYRADSGPIEAYATSRQIERINREILLPHGHPTPIIHDKVWFDRWLAHHGLPRVPVLAVIRDGVLTREGQPPVEGAAARAVLLTLLETSGPLFVKPVEGLQGRDCRRLEVPTDVDAWVGGAPSQPMLVQSVVRQHPDLAAVYPLSVNTVRVQTCRLSPGRDGHIRVATGMLRVGGGGSVLDNAAQGGLYAALDLGTGRLTSPFLASIEHGGRGHRAHPDTGAVAAQVVVPHVAAAVRLVEQGHRWLPNELVAWDVAVTADGPVIIEANDQPPLHGVQAAAGGLWSDPIYRQVLGKVRR